MVSAELDEVRKRRKALLAALEAYEAAVQEAWQLGATQREIGDAAGVSQTQIWRVLQRSETTD